MEMETTEASDAGTGTCNLRNVEIKAKVNNVKELIKTASELSNNSMTVLLQDDTFYNIEAGRLKMRFEGNSGTLVRYDRSDIEGPKVANYDLLPLELDEAKTLHEILVRSIGIKGRVVKERKLFMVGQTRIHIDSVKDLGDFMELEVVLRPDQTINEGESIAKDLQMKLGVRDEDLLDCAYVDLLLK